MKISKELEKVLETVGKSVVHNIVVYDMSPVTPYYDYSVIASASSARQAHAAVEYLRDLSDEGFNVRGYSAMNDALWCLVDLGSIVVHIFVGEERARYNLDGLYYNLDKQEINN